MTDLVKPLDDIRLPFQIESFGVRGRLVRLGPALDTIISTHGYPDLVGGMLAEAIVLSRPASGFVEIRRCLHPSNEGQWPDLAFGGRRHLGRSGAGLRAIRCRRVNP